ncbi:MAG: Zn-dependent hydrolase, partial [Bacteroidales bacterium]|nr:Zn-dependent hydrolase [Bacteroidales bacterium]
MNKKKQLVVLTTMFVITTIVFGFAGKEKQQEEQKKSKMQQKVEEFAVVELKTDLSVLSKKERQIITIFIDIADIMNDLFWKQSFGDKSLLDTISDEWTKKFALINYGP